MFSRKYTIPFKNTIFSRKMVISKEKVFFYDRKKKAFFLQYFSFLLISWGYVTAV